MIPETGEIWKTDRMTKGQVATHEPEAAIKVRRLPAKTRQNSLEVQDGWLSTDPAKNLITIRPGVDESKLTVQRQVSRTPWNKGLKGHACKNPETCYHKIKPSGMKRPGQSEAMRRAYAENPGLVEVRRQQMATRWRLGLMSRAKIREGILRSLVYRKPMSPEGRARQISAARGIVALLNSKILPEHSAKVASRMKELMSIGVQLIYVDLKGHQKPDLIWFDGKRIVGEDVKSNRTD